MDGSPGARPDEGAASALGEPGRDQPEPATRPGGTIGPVLERLTADAWFRHVETSPGRSASAGDVPTDLPHWLSRELPGLWSHQSEAIRHARAGRSTVITTGTGSGKSLTFQVPIVEAASRPHGAGTSLILVPTKALARDQQSSLQRLAPELSISTHDGDSTPAERARTRNTAHVAITNPEMLHHDVLPNHRRWERFLAQLSYVAVDELHACRGVFGSHVANVLRRLFRLCERLGSAPTVITTTATTGDPVGLARALTGHECELVSNDGSPQPERYTAICDPAGFARPMAPRSASAAVAAELVKAGARTLVFCRSRVGTELVAIELRRRLPPTLARQVHAYRGGHLAIERQGVEDELVAGRALCIVTTSALELGLDVGGLDAVVVNGFPGTVASFRQQAGRAGRGGQASLAVLVAGPDPLDRWFCEHPEELLGRDAERAVINPDNPHVVRPHVRCAANEAPIGYPDRKWWNDLDDTVRDLVLDDSLVLRRPPGKSPLALWAGQGWPASSVGLRSDNGGEVRILASDGSAVGTVGVGMAVRHVHPGAVYLHRGIHWRVVELDLVDRIAWVEPSAGDVVTHARSTSRLDILEVDRRTRLGCSISALGTVEVESRVTGFVERDARTGRVIGQHELELDPSRLVTTATWFDIPGDVLAEGANLPEARWPGSLHALEHAAIGMLPLFAVCDRWDVGGVSTCALGRGDNPGVVIYDGQAGGAGIAELAHEMAGDHLVATLGAIARCGCSEGCPSCVVSPKCGNGNEPLDKDGAKSVLGALTVAA